MIQSLFLAHKSIFNQDPTGFYFSPGRVNLIGEHVDYCGGHVLPMALDRGTYASVSKRRDSKVLLYSKNYPSKEIQTIDLNQLDYDANDGYISYAKGMIKAFFDHGFTIKFGLNIYIEGNLPTSAGLSSSASFELLIAKILEKENNYTIDAMHLVSFAKGVENIYLGLSSGIMDQFSVAFGKKDHAILLHTKTLEYGYIPIDLKNYVIVMMNTNKKRDLIHSDYNTRVDSIEKATAYFKEKLKVDTLCDVNPAQFERLKDGLDKKTAQRAKHVIEENQRTLDSYHALKMGDYHLFGTLMNESHDSLKTLYEVSCAELDFLVDFHRDQGALGARMTGAGFGGTMIALYNQKDYPNTYDRLIRTYQEKFNKPIEIMVAKAFDGTHELKRGIT